MKIKFFHFHEPVNVEARINEWLDENGTTTIYHIKQTESTDNDKWSLSIAIYYIEALTEEES